MTQLEDALGWLAAAVAALASWIFRSHATTTNKRLEDLEGAQTELHKEVMQTRTDFIEALTEHNKEDMERHERDRKENVDAIERMLGRLDKQHEFLVHRLDKLADDK